MTKEKDIAYRSMGDLHGENPIFNDEIYKECFKAAQDSPCQKMKFGVIIMHGTDIVYSGSNTTIPPLRQLCEPECIRLNINSRTEQMLGACAHAEELGIWEVAKKGIPLSECSVYIAGFKPDDTPWMKKTAEHTCLRCSTQMYNAGVGAIYVPVNDHWEKLSPEEAVKTAATYALGTKKV